MRTQTDGAPEAKAARLERALGPDAALPSIAVILPCWNEEAAIASVVRDFADALPTARIYVFDNNSADNTARVAAEAGAEVRVERQQGKGHVVRRAFADIEAELYVLADGDDTYDAASAPAMVELLLAEHLDMVTGVRIPENAEAYRPGHVLGNRLLTGAVRLSFGDRITDMLSGFRVFSRRFVKSFPALSVGFETETEFTVHALELNMPVGEVETRYKARPPGSVSKLRTFHDGLRILRTIMTLIKEERPVQFFSLLGAVLMLLGIALGIPIVATFVRTGLVPRLPTAVLASGLEVMAGVMFTCGLVLGSVSRARSEVKRLAYLGVTGPGIARGE